MAEASAPKKKWQGLLHKRNPYHKALKAFGAKKKDPANTDNLDEDLARLEAENAAMEKRLQLNSRPSFHSAGSSIAANVGAPMLIGVSSGRAASVRHARCDALVRAFQEGKMYGQAHHKIYPTVG